jgi:hypothetical protein
MRVILSKSKNSTEILQPSEGLQAQDDHGDSAYRRKEDVR